MGRQARLRAMRRAASGGAGAGVLDPDRLGTLVLDPPVSQALDILRELLYDIRRLTLQPARRCWELLVEMMAHHSGWNTDTDEDDELWDIVPLARQRLFNYATTWNREVHAAHITGSPFAEPLGELLAESDPAHSDMPMELVHMENDARLRELRHGDAPIPGALFRNCGTGRFVLHTLVFDPDVQTYVCEENLWLYRAMLVNVRFLARYSSRRLHQDGDLAATAMALHTEGSAVLDRLTAAGIETHLDPAHLSIVGGRIWAVNADPEIIDLDFAPNWQFGMQFWTLTPPWQYSLLIDQKKFGFWGTWSEYLSQHSESEVAARLHRPAGRTSSVRYDFAMSDPG